jgi:hypothetical protein
LECGLVGEPMARGGRSNSRRARFAPRLPCFYAFAQRIGVDGTSNRLSKCPTPYMFRAAEHWPLALDLTESPHHRSLFSHPWSVPTRAAHFLHSKAFRFSAIEYGTTRLFSAFACNLSTYEIFQPVCSHDRCTESLPNCGRAPRRNCRNPGGRPGASPGPEVQWIIA